MTQDWTPERTAVLIMLWGQGIPASEIGRRLGVTKNAVIGKAFRLQLSKRRPAVADPAEESSVIRLERVGAGMCVWPLETADGRGFHFCGESTVPGKPYCPTHCRAAYLPVAKSRRVVAVA